MRLFEQRDIAGDRTPEVHPRVSSLGNGEDETFQRGELGKKLIDLKGTLQAGTRTPMSGHRGDVAAGKVHLPCARAQHTGQEVDEGRLACAVRPDQGVARTGRKRERNAVRRGDAAEALFEADSL